MKPLLILFFLSTNLLADALEWTEKSLEIKTVIVQEKREGIFCYENKSKKVICFIKIKASCGCVLVDASESVAQGDKGADSF
ncbi:MAG: DUF1573 domain-containing protein [Lentisphaerales bacterium]|nr:DUF1573 domain-containing protein [Lentisphaerales bacterium]